MSRESLLDFNPGLVLDETTHFVTHTEEQREGDVYSKRVLKKGCKLFHVLSGAVSASRYKTITKFAHEVAETDQVVQKFIGTAPVLVVHRPLPKPSTPSPEEGVFEVVNFPPQGDPDEGLSLIVKTRGTVQKDSIGDVLKLCLECRGWDKSWTYGEGGVITSPDGEEIRSHTALIAAIRRVYCVDISQELANSPEHLFPNLLDRSELADHHFSSVSFSDDFAASP